LTHHREAAQIFESARRDGLASLHGRASSDDKTLIIVERATRAERTPA
jgi:hypothetical protein